MAERQPVGWLAEQRENVTRLGQAVREARSLVGQLTRRADKDELYPRVRVAVAETKAHEVDDPTSKIAAIFELAPDEVDTAPEPLQSVFVDLNITPERGAELRLARYGGVGESKRRIDLTIVPKEGSKERIGVMLSSKSGEGAIVLPDPIDVRKELSLPFYPRIAEAGVYLRAWQSIKSPRADALRGTYREFAGKRDDSVLSSAQPHPHRVAILTSGIDFLLQMHMVRERASHVASRS